MNRNSAIIVTAFILFAALARLLPHPYNFTPLGAIALFGAAYFANKKWALLVPLLALWISDLFLNNYVYSAFYDGFAWFTGGFIYLYGSLALTVVLGFILLKKITVGRVLGGALGASVLFFAVSNFGVWLSSPMYPLTAEGFLMCYTAAIPFFHNTLAGNIVYSAALFGAYEWLKQTYPSLQPLEVRSGE